MPQVALIERVSPSEYPAGPECASASAFDVEARCGALDHADEQGSHHVHVQCRRQLHPGERGRPRLQKQGVADVTVRRLRRFALCVRDEKR